MKGKLLFIGCNDNQIPYLKVINKDEWNVIGIDLNKNAPGKDICDKFYNIGYDNLEGLIDVGLKENFTSDDKVFSAASQFSHKGAAHFSSFFGISYPPEKSIDLCLNKVSYYDYFTTNNIPIPKTWKIRDEDNLKAVIREQKPSYYFLKSDYSKNPSYVYQFHSSSVPWENFFWGKDRYLREYYLLQEEAQGVSLRLNIFGKRFNVFDFQTGLKTDVHKDHILSLNIIKTLENFLTSQNMTNWLVKFDIILGIDEYFVLDIGIDPPSRMLKLSKENKVNFEKYYLEQYLYGNINYPSLLD